LPCRRGNRATSQHCDDQLWISRAVEAVEELMQRVEVACERIEESFDKGGAEEAILNPCERTDVIPGVWDIVKVCIIMAA
jgi:hypothetical protein